MRQNLSGQSYDVVITSAICVRLKSNGDWCMQYSLWLDQHSMAEALEQIRGALDACAPAATGQPGFDEVFPLMQRLASGSGLR